MTLRTTGEGVRWLWACQQRITPSNAGLVLSRRMVCFEKFVVADLDLQQHEALNGIIFNSENFRSV